LQLHPHVLGWAKIPNSPYWPVKIMQDRGDELTVRCFADYRRYDVPKDTCFFFSKKPPVKTSGGKRRGEMLTALLVRIFKGFFFLK
jgi:hypothetical protein